MGAESPKRNTDTIYPLVLSIAPPIPINKNSNNANATKNSLKTSVPHGTMPTGISNNGKLIGTTKNWTTLSLALAPPAEAGNCKTPAAVPTQTGGPTALLLLNAVLMVPSPQSVLVKQF